MINCAKKLPMTKQDWSGVNKARRERKLADPEKAKAQKAQDNKRQYMRTDRSLPADEKLLAWRRKCRYGITPEQYAKMVEDQDNKCAICTTSFDETKAYIDHCHDSLKVRGLLCNNCNTGLGRFKDNTDLLTKALDYLGNSLQRVAR